ncbi:MAG: efflux RND transporter periplasmic adaptor subunit [Bacteroidales bacterium]|nr:efflux RND transporter periplasmic adaptor subunit [Bacteroidales bacterium]
MKKSTKTIWIAIGAVAVLALLFFLLKPSAKEVVTLETSRVGRIDISNSVTATGTVEPVTEVEVGTQVSGIVSKLYVDYNDVVKAGQVIAEMDKINLQAELKSAQAQLSSAKTEYEYRQKEYNRMNTLHEKELVSDSEYDQALYQFQTAQNAYSQSLASLTKVQRNLSYATITSPIDGVVISRAVEEGQTVAAGFETPTLFKIAKNLTEMQVIADVDEADIGQVVEGQRVSFTVDAYPEDVFEGDVKQVRLEATTTSNVVTYEVVINAPNPTLKLKPGLTANITIYTLEEEGVLAVPTKSLRFHPDAEVLGKMGIAVNGQAAPETDSTRTVWVREGDSVSPKTVVTGYTSGDRTAVLSGLQEGQEVVSGLSTVTTGTKKEKTAERSPFAPGPPGGGNERRQGNDEKE